MTSHALCTQWPISWSIGTIQTISRLYSPLPVSDGDRPFPHLGSYSRQDRIKKAAYYLLESQQASQEILCSQLCRFGRRSEDWNSRYIIKQHEPNRENIHESSHPTTLKVWQKVEKIVSAAHSDLFSIIWIQDFGSNSYLAVDSQSSSKPSPCNQSASLFSIAMFASLGLPCSSCLIYGWQE